MILLVNKNNLFNEDMLHSFEIVEYENYREETIYLEKETLKHFEMLQAHLKIEGIVVDIEDGYRSLETQENIFLKFMQKYGIAYAEDTVAMPGTSEHHTGQAIDLLLKKGEEWLTENSDLLKEEIFAKIHDVLLYFGFILRYPKGKEEITGYAYEPWHIRFVGELATRIQQENLTLEEFLEKYPEEKWEAEKSSSLTI